MGAKTVVGVAEGGAPQAADGPSPARPSPGLANKTMIGFAASSPPAGPTRPVLTEQAAATAPTKRHPVGATLLGMTPIEGDTLKSDAPQPTAADEAAARAAKRRAQGGTMLGVAMPGIAPTHDGPPAPQPVSPSAGAGHPARSAPQIVPLPPRPERPADEPLPEAPPTRDRRGVSIAVAAAIAGVLTLVTITGVVGLLLQVPIGLLVDRTRRVPVALGGAVAWGLASLATGLAPTIVVLGVCRTASGLGKAIIDPTHQSLIADHYPPDVRVRAYSFHRAANAVGAFVGPLAAGLIAAATSWRVPFVVFAIPTLLVVVAGMKLREARRGAESEKVEA